MTRASVVEVMNSGYVRTAILKGLTAPAGGDAARAAQRHDGADHGHHAACQLVHRRAGGD